MSSHKPPYPGFGLGPRPQHHNDILGTRPDAGWFEVISENYLLPVPLSEEALTTPPHAFPRCRMTKLADLQHDIHMTILDMATGGTILDMATGGERHLAAPCNATRGQRLAVYGDAYLLRLTEFLASDFEQLKRYLGETRFNGMARAYVRHYPSGTPNARWFSRHLPAFLKDHGDYRRHPEVAELAALEQALNDVFDGPDGPVVTMRDLPAIDPQVFGETVLDLVPAVRKFAVFTNAASLWSSLRCGETPPSAIDLRAPAQILVWRQNLGSRFRILGNEEAMALDGVAEGLSFGAICEMMAALDDADGAALRAAGYLRGWLEAEIISRFRRSVNENPT